MREDRIRIDRLLEAGHACIRMVTEEEQHAWNVIWDAATARQMTIRRWSATRGLEDALLQDGEAVPDTLNAAAALATLCDVREPEVTVFLDLGPHLEDPSALRALREAIAHYRRLNATIVLIDHEDVAPRVVASCSSRVEIALPDEQELSELVRRTVRGVHSRKKVELNLTNSQLQSIVRNLAGLTRDQAEQVVMDFVTDDYKLDESDLDTVVARKRQFLHVDGLLEFVEAPTDLDQIGGLDNLKRWLTQRERSFSDGAAEFGLTPPRGVLLLGVQGAGKSLCAKAIATAWRRPLLRLDPSSLYDKFIGQSEHRLRQALNQAEAMSPIVLWIDEIEKGFASAASRSADGGLSQRMFGTLLTWMQEHSAPVFLVATANDIEALPPELLRKGRFDEIFFVDLPTEDVRRRIFEIHIEKRGHELGDIDITALASASVGFSGAEIEQAVLSALHGAYHKDAVLDTKRILTAIRNSPPLSVTMRERVDTLREWAMGRCVPASATH